MSPCRAVEDADDKQGARYCALDPATKLALVRLDRFLILIGAQFPPMTQRPGSRGLHSSTFQLNLSRF